MTAFFGSGLTTSHLVPSAEAGTDPLAPTIFHESWWLDIATEGRYDVAEVSENGRIVGRLPYYRYKKIGMSIVGLPPLTHFLGPAVISAKPRRRFDITKELIRKLPPAVSFYIKCHRDVQETIAFQCAGFFSSVQFTHEIHPQPVDVLWKKLHIKTRRVIRRASECHSVCVGNDPAAFIEFYHRNIVNRGKAETINPAVCSNLIQACLERNRGRLYEARDHSGELAAGIFCAWDKVASYYLMSSRRLAAHLGITSLLVWEAIADAANRGLIFDFDGDITEGGARFAYNFTSNVAPRYVASRQSRIIRAVKSLVREPNFFA